MERERVLERSSEVVSDLEQTLAGIHNSADFDPVRTFLERRFFGARCGSSSAPKKIS